MGKVTIDIKLRNHFDQMLQKDNPEQAIRSLELENVLVDSGASMLCLSKDIIDELGLVKLRTKNVNTAIEQIILDIYGTVELEIMERAAVFEVMELKHPTIKGLVGQIPLESFDLLIHPGINRLIPNPEHDNKLVLDLLLTDDILGYK